MDLLVKYTISLITYYIILMKSWKWSNGDVYEKSPRIIRNNNNGNFGIEEEKNQDYYNNIVIDNRAGAVQQSLEIFDNISSSSYNKIADRDMFMQVGANPFLQNNNYVNDILMQDRFLKPVSTTENENRKGKSEKESASTQYSANFDY